MRITRVLAAGVVAVAVSALAGCAGDGGDGRIEILIGSSGDAETEAVTTSAEAWGESNDREVRVLAASNLQQQLSQGFAGGSPPDVFYMAWDQFATFAQNGFLEPYAEDLPNRDDFYPNLIDTFTYNGVFTCAPKDFSTLGLIINTQLWEAAGLTDADIPTDWDGLKQVAEQLTGDGVVGLSFGPEYARIGVFMNQAGGQLVDGDTVTADSPENLAGLEFVKSLYDSGALRFPSDIGAGWAGEALGNGSAAMVIEGPWIRGIANDFPDTEYTAHELPAGPGGSSTFTFTNCWGIPATGGNTDDAVSLVEHFTSDEEQLKFSDAFGVIPSTISGAAEYAQRFPESEAFVAGADYAVSPVNFAGSASVITDFNAQLEGLSTGADPAAILAKLQTELQPALDAALEAAGSE